jgi:hypothetical protein
VSEWHETCSGSWLDVAKRALQLWQTSNDLARVRLEFEVERDVRKRMEFEIRKAKHEAETTSDTE